MTSIPHCNSLATVLLLGLLSGCAAVPSTGSSAAHPGAGYLIHLPGIAGDTPFDRAWMTGLRDGGAADQLRLYDWTCHRPGLDALQAYARNRAQADLVAKLIARRRRADPTGRIILTAESGGTGVAIWALERLPRGTNVDEVLLIAPALSPTYDLTEALQHVNKSLHSFNSPGDWFMLGVGTRVFGTIDGVHTDAAGLVGFHRPRQADAVQYQKLMDMKYDQAWMQYGDLGNHAGGMSVAFARYFLAPMLLRDQRPSADLVLLSAGGGSGR